jgi:hypothetical protein
MPIRTAPDRPRDDPSSQRDPTILIDRAPVMIPQLFVAPSPPWYRRRSFIVLGAFGLACVVALGVVVYLEGINGAVELLGRGSVAVLRAFTRIVA